MTHVSARDGTRLYVEKAGPEKSERPPILFLHEYSGDHRSWAGQVEHFKATHRCFVTAARGYPPSDVPPDPEMYSPAIAANDAFAVMDGLGIEKAHVVGLSMGAYTGLLMAMDHPDRMASLLAASGGSGSHPADDKTHGENARKLAAEIRAAGAFPADAYALGPTRLPLRRKNAPAWRTFRDQLAEHDPTGAANLLERYLAQRPSLYTYEDRLKLAAVPTLLMVGDEDDPVIEINIWLKRTMPAAGLNVRRNSGHLLNLEEPDVFNADMAAFLDAVEAGAWPGLAPAAERKAG